MVNSQFDIDHVCQFVVLVTSPGSPHPVGRTFGSHLTKSDKINLGRKSSEYLQNLFTKFIYNIYLQNLQT